RAAQTHRGRMNFRQAIADLDARQPERMVPDLSRISALAELMDHPERTYPTIHVTGTNGKTTTARMITSLACAHGLSTGTYTSPHLGSVNERLSLCSEPISEQEFGDEYERLLPYLREVDTATADRAGEVGAPLRMEGRDFRLAERTTAAGGQVLSVQTPQGSYRSLGLPLLGEHAGRDAAAAIVALEALLGRALSEDAARAGFAAVRSPGRLEVVGRRPLVVLDGAHNPAAAAAIASALPEAFTWDRLFLVLGVSSNKDLDGIVEQLAPLRPTVLAASHSSPRSFA